MESFLSDYLVLFQNLALPGFFYLLVVLVLIQDYANIEIIKILKENKDFLIYISILVIVFSFVMGLVAHLALQEVKTLLRIPSNSSRVQGEISINVYGVLIMIRHLLISISFLVISIAIYFIRTKKRLNNKRFFTFIYTLMFLILSLAYFKIRDVFVKMSDSKQNCCWILILYLMLFLVSFMLIRKISSKKSG